MLDLSRSVRFCVELPRPAGPARRGQPPAGRFNTFAAWPPMLGIGAFYELEVHCHGEVDARVGYLLNIAEIDRVVRRDAVPLVQAAIDEDPDRDPATLLPSLLAAIQPGLAHAVASIRWRLSPYYSVAMQSESPDRVTLSQTFEFAASHRLHCDDLTDEENRARFGKCSSPHGHGHNYRLEVSVSKPLSANGRTGPDLVELERIVHERVVSRFDHRHLNQEVEEFDGLNPSVENITKVCYDLLHAPLEQAGGRLERVRVWETEKTSCTYPV